MMRAVVMLFLAMSVSSTALADDLPLSLLDANAVRVNGSIGDWRGLRFRNLGSGSNGSMKYVLGYDAEALYVAADVKDDVMVRTRTQGRAEDAVVITLAISTDDGMRVTEVWLYAGVMGEQAAAALIGTPGGGLSAVAGAQVIEGPTERGKGYVLEARIPWSSIPGGQQWQGGGGAVTLHDVDRGGDGNDITSARLDLSHPEALPRLAPSGMAAATLENFMSSRGISSVPRFDLRGDVAGDRRPEQVAIVDVSVVVLGPGYRSGTSYSFAQLPVVRSSDVISAELDDVTGDGKAELLLKLRQQRDAVARDLFQVFDVGADQPRPIFSIEARKQTGDGEVSADITVERGKRGRPPTIVVKVGSARGLSAANYRNAPEAGVESMLLPWGEVTERTYQWDGTRFAPIDEKTAEGSRTPTPSSAAPVVAVSQGSQAPEQPPAPPGIDQLVDAFRRAQSIDRRVEARLKRNANVAEDARVEQLMLFDRSLLVIGPGYRNGTGFFYYQLPVESADDIQRVFTADVTGDGRAEIFIRVRQLIGEVKRELLYVHQLDGNELRQLMVAEVRRAEGAQSIGNIVRLRWRGNQATLVIYPGRATGWSQADYPFVTDTSDGTDALLLPWNDSMVTYRVDADRLVR